jgi:hypothetical protein
MSFTNSVIDASPERSKLIDQKYERLQRVVAFYADGAPLFVEYLRLDMKVRYFWPPPAKQRIGDTQSTKQSTISLTSLLKRKWAEKKRK